MADTCTPHPELGRTEDIAECHVSGMFFSLEQGRKPVDVCVCVCVCACVCLRACTVVLKEILVFCSYKVEISESQTRHQILGRLDYNANGIHSLARKEELGKWEPRYQNEDIWEDSNEDSKDHRVPNSTSFLFK